MYSDNNLIYIFTILESIEKIDIYTKNLADDEEFYYAKFYTHLFYLKTLK